MVATNNLITCVKQKVISKNEWIEEKRKVSMWFDQKKKFQCASRGFFFLTTIKLNYNMNVQIEDFFLFFQGMLKNVYNLKNQIIKIS